MKETLDVEVISPTSVKYIEDLSGGEQFRVAFSVRLALAAVQARRQGGDLTLLLLDEVSSSLDKVGIETFVSIVKELQKTMIVMLITHDDSLKEHFDNVIKVSNDGQIAKIIQ
jgi:exonuclease SbcC